MRAILVLLAAVALVFVAGFGGLRGFEQYRFADDASALAGPLGDIGEVSARVADAVDEGGALSKGIAAFSGWPDDTVSALRRGAIVMMVTGGLAILLLLSMMAGARGAVILFAVLVIAGGVASWVLNPDVDLGPMAGVTQDLWDMGPMSDSSPKTVGLLLGAVAVLGALTAMAAQASRNLTAARA